VFQLIPAKRFVHIIHEKQHLHRQLPRVHPLSLRAQDVEFMDGIIHSNSQLSLCVGASRLGALHQPLRLAEGLLSEHGRAQRKTTSKRPNYFYRYDHGYQRTSQVVSGTLLLGKLLGSSQILRIAEKARGWCSTTRVRT